MQTGHKEVRHWQSKSWFLCHVLANTPIIQTWLLTLQPFPSSALQQPGASHLPVASVGQRSTPALVSCAAVPVPMPPAPLFLHAPSAFGPPAPTSYVAERKLFKRHVYKLGKWVYNKGLRKQNPETQSQNRYQKNKEGKGQEKTTCEVRVLWPDLCYLI